MPYKLTYVVTKECHSRCVNCRIWEERPSGELTLEEVRRLARNSPFLSWIDFTGGEPTDRPDFAALAAAFLENISNLLLIHFPTNGLKPRRIEECARGILRAKPPRLVITVSIDGPPEVHDRLRGIPGGFERAMETYCRLCALPAAELYIGMTLYSENAGLVEQTFSEIRRRAPDFRPARLHVNLPHRSEHYYGNTVQPPPLGPEVCTAAGEVLKQRGMPMSPFAVLERMYQKRISAYAADGRCPEDCAALFSSCYLAEDGQVYPCTIWNESLGSIRDTGFKLAPLVKSSRAADLRRRLLLKQCPGCWTPCEAYPTLLANVPSFSRRSRPLEGGR